MPCDARTILSLGLVVFALASAACREEGTVIVHSLRFEGVKAVDEARLKGVLATRQGSKLPWGRKLYFDRSRFDADLKRIEAFYADRGYPDARVAGFDVRLNDKQDAVDVTLTIAEGEPVRVAAIEFAGFDSVPPRNLDDLKQRAAAEGPASRATGSWWSRRTRWRSTSCAITGIRTPACQPPRARSAGTSSLTFTAEPGTLAHFGPVEIVGNSSVGEGVIRRQLTYKPGDLYRRSVVQDSQRRLYGLELFQFVNVEALNPERQDPEVRTRVTVAEGKHQRVNFGVGYGSEEKGRVDGEYHHVNFLGGARTAGAHARWSSLDRGVRLDFNQPYVFAPRFSLEMEAQHWYTFTPAYQSITTGGRVTLTHRPSRQTSWSVSLLSERDDSSISDDALSDPTLRDDLIALGLDPTTGHQEGTINALGFDFQRSTADNLLNARRGYQLALHTESAGRLLPGTFNYFALSVDGRHYHADRQSLRGGEPASDRDHRRSRRRWDERAVLEEVFPGRGDQPARVGTLRGEPAQRVGLAARRQQPAGLECGASRIASGPAGRRPVRRCGQRLARRMAIRTLGDLRVRWGRVCATRPRSVLSASTSDISSIRSRD